MKWYFILSLIPYFAYIVFKAKKYMHMLQQNWYNDGNRYVKWVMNNFEKVFLVFDVLFIIFAFLKNKYAIIAFVVFYIICYVLHRNKVRKEQSKKPLVITARIKRLYTTMLILHLVCIIPMIILYNDINLQVFYVFMGLLVYINPFIIWLSNIINKPIEKMVFNHYKRMAKNKLKAMPNLMKVGITGSYGKTSTKNALNDILNVKFNSFATEKSFNTMNGLMISINNKLDKFSDIFVAEKGAFRQGEIKEKADFIEPQYAILTTIGTAHLEDFGCIENTQKAKFELIESLPRNGVAILNKDDEYQTSYKINSKCKKVWVSMRFKEADVYASDVKLSNKGTTFKVKFADTKKVIELETKLLGSANVYNVLQAVALAHEFGLSDEQIKIGVKRIATIEHRLELKKFADINIIDDAYNSNPVGSKMAVDVLGMMPGKKIIVTPGMIELGEKQYEYNMKFGRQIAKVCDEVILIGEEQTKPILDGLKKEKYNEEKIHILNDVKKAFPLMRKLKDKETYVLLENDLPDIFNE